MTSISTPSSAQRLSSPHLCKHCRAIIPVGPFKPRRFCSDACRKAAARASKRTNSEAEVPEVGSTENNAPAVKSSKIDAEKHNKIKARVNGQNEPSIPLNLIGGYRWPGVRPLDPDLVAKILSAELGTPVEIMVSTDGITTTITPTHHQNSAASPTGRTKEADPMPGARHRSCLGRHDCAEHHLIHHHHGVSARVLTPIS
jgi:hypothetical protein